MSALPAPPVRNIYLSFQGVSPNGGYRQSFDVLCGANPPKPVDGYGKWEVDDRYLEQGMSVFQGYNPAKLQVQVIFGKWENGWQIDDTSGRAVEGDRKKLQWMAGALTSAGLPPIVYVYSHSTQGGDTDLIPAEYRGLPWVIDGGVQWGKEWLNPNGLRVWIEASFTLMNYLNLNKPPAPDTTMKGGYFTSRPGRDTALLIAGAPSGNSPIVDHQRLAAAILKNPKNNPCKGTSIRLARKSKTWPIRHGVHVWVPQHQSL